jgi:hypothetical protein
LINSTYFFIIIDDEETELYILRKKFKGLQQGDEAQEEAEKENELGSKGKISFIC